ncbi:MAG TPA: hypothetical protein VMH87_06245 [Pseudomonadales bacterium]|nr:hypothetical protein [Pseudomonadales bacterium]
MDDLFAIPTKGADMYAGVCVYLAHEVEKIRAKEINNGYYVSRIRFRQEAAPGVGVYDSAAGVVIFIGEIRELGVNDGRIISDSIRG